MLTYVEALLSAFGPSIKCTFPNCGHGTCFLCRTCPAGNCSITSLWWHDQQEFGVPLYAKGRLNSTSLAITSPSTSTWNITSLSTSNWTASYLLVLHSEYAVNEQQIMPDGLCGVASNSQDYCGTFVSACLAAAEDAPTLGSLNVQESYTFFGDVTQAGANDGSLTYTKQYFANAGAVNPCHDIGVSIIANGCVDSARVRSYSCSSTAFPSRESNVCAVDPPPCGTMPTMISSLDTTRSKICRATPSHLLRDISRSWSRTRV
jgi:hypothetical protein